ncbi:hypothetical protein L7F22_027298 [Adiantum nelumboides]|nr:hypothetical protein [Adiantum nelumboides]
MQFESSWGTMQIGNLYAHNDAGMRKDLWIWLAHLDWKQGADWTMISPPRTTHTTSLSTVMSLIESTEWDKLHGEAALIYVWDSATRSSPGFTFHSLSHQGSWSRLDTIYFIGSAWLPNSEDMQVYVSSALSGHFPLILQLTDVNLDTMLSFGHSKPLLINNSVLNHKHFRHQVEQLIHQASELHKNPLSSWLCIVAGMQQCIRSVGKLIKQQGNVRLKKAIAMAETLVAKAGCTALCHKEMQDLMEARTTILVDWELAQTKTQRFLCRQWDDGPSLTSGSEILEMMGILYKLLAKTIAIRITPELRKHSAQTGFISGRSIFNNILTVQLGIEHAVNSKQDMVMFQIDFEKAFDTVQWDFVSSIMTKMGFGARISGFINLLGLNAYSRIVINGRLSAKHAKVTGPHEQLRYLVNGKGVDYVISWRLTDDQRSVELTGCCCSGTIIQNGLETSFTSLEPFMEGPKCPDIAIAHSKTRVCEYLIQMPLAIPLESGLHGQVLFTGQPQWINMTNSDACTINEISQAKVYVPMPTGLLELGLSNQALDNPPVLQSVMDKCGEIWMGSNKMDRASILGDAIEYVKELQKQVKVLQEELLETKEEDIEHNPVSSLQPDDGAGGHLIEENGIVLRADEGQCSLKTDHIKIPSEIDERRLDDLSQPMQVAVSKLDGQLFNLRIFCEKRPGVFVKLMQALDVLGLELLHANITTFRGLVLNVFNAESYPLKSDIDEEKGLSEPVHASIVAQRDHETSLLKSVCDMDAHLESSVDVDLEEIAYAALEEVVFFPKTISMPILEEEQLGDMDFLAAFQDTGDDVDVLDYDPYIFDVNLDNNYDDGDAYSEGV